MSDAVSMEDLSALNFNYTTDNKISAVYTGTNPLVPVNLTQPSIFSGDDLFCGDDVYSGETDIVDYSISMAPGSFNCLSYNEITYGSRTVVANGKGIQVAYYFNASGKQLAIRIYSCKYSVYKFDINKFGVYR